MASKTAKKMVKGAGHECIPGHPRIAYCEQERRPDSSLYTQRAHQPLDRRLLLSLLPAHRPGVLVALHVLDGVCARLRTYVSLLASLCWFGLHPLYSLAVQSLARLSC